jgi:putative phosphoesterase
MSRFGVLGDVHCEDVALAAALKLFERERVEKVLAVGDLVDGPGDARRTVELLQHVDVVRGNHERWHLDHTMRGLPDATPPEALDKAHRAWLGALPQVKSYATPHGRLMLCHGLGNDDMSTLKPDDFGYALETNDALQRLLKRGDHRFVVSGHSHQRMVRKLEEVTFINAGTLLREHEPCVVVLDFDALTATFHDWRDGTYVAAAPVALP